MRMGCFARPARPAHLALRDVRSQKYLYVRLFRIIIIFQMISYHFATLFR